MSQGLISLFIPLIVIILAMVTKRIIAALVVGSRPSGRRDTFSRRNQGILRTCK